MKREILWSLGACVLVGDLLVPARADSQQAEPSGVFPARSEAVTVDVVVVDSQGQTVKGLTREDFVVREDGLARSVTAFREVIRTPAETTEAPREAETVTVDTNDEARPDRGRVFLVLFDDVHLTPLQAQRSRDALTRFLDTTVHPGDHVIFQASSGGIRKSARIPQGLAELHAWVSAQKGLRAEDDARGRISAWEARRVSVLNDQRLSAEIARRLREVGLIAENLNPPGEPGYLKNFQLDQERETQKDDKDSKSSLVRAMAAAVYTQATSETRAALGTLRDALDTLSIIPGRKTVLFVSAGFFRDPSEPLFAPVADAASRANAAVDFLDARELTGLPDNSSIEMERVTDPRDHAVYDRDRYDAEGSEAVALETGGLILRGRLQDELDRAARQTESYYLIGYEPAWTQTDGRYHRIEVEVKRPGVTVRARRGYHATGTTAAAGGLHPDVRRALESPLEAAGVTLRLASYVLGRGAGGKTLVALAGTADGTSLSWTAKDGRFAGGLETDFRVTPLAGGEPSDRERRYELRLSAQEHAAALSEGVPLLGDFELSPGRYLARLVVRDPASGRVGSVFHELEVPAAGFRLSTPILTDMVQKDASGEMIAIPLARRTFDAGKRLYCSFQVLDAAAVTEVAPPRTTFEVAVFRSDGTALARSPAQPLAPGPSGEPARLIAISLQNARPDEYRFVLRVRDDTTARTLEHQERFRVKGSSSAGAAASPTAAAAPAAGAAAAKPAAYSDLLTAYRRGETSRALSGLVALGPVRGRDGARSLRRADAGCDARCLEAAALMHTEAAIAAPTSADMDAQLATSRELLETLPDGAERREWLRDWLLAAGYLLEAQSRLLEAQRLFEQAERVSPGDAEALLAQGTVEEVLSLLPDLVPREREPPPVGSSMLPELLERSRRDRYETRALALYERALARDGELSEARLRRGRIRAERGQAAEATADLETVTQEAGQPYLRSLACLFLGDLEERAGRNEKAVERYRAALEARPGFQTATVALAHALDRLGRGQAARRAVTDALSVAASEPEDPWIGYHLGLGWRRDGALDALKRRLQP